jgi:hypothetical protein
MWAANWLVARGVYGTLWQGYRLIVLVREEYMATLDTQLLVTVLAAGCAALLAPMGTSVLFLVAPTILIPQLLLPSIARSRDVSMMSQATAAQLYVRALAAHLGISRRERRAAQDAIALLLDPAHLTVGPRSAHRAWFAAFHAAERWDGRGHPAALAGGVIPHQSRLLATATEWAKLTAAGGPRLSQREAILALELQAATKLDPALVAAAGEIVHTEAQFADLDSFQPQLDLLPLPRPVRSQLLPWALRAYG